MPTGPRLTKHSTGGQITIVVTPFTCHTKSKPKWFGPRAGMSSPSSREDEASRRCLNCMDEHPGECPCGWCNQPGHISLQCTTRHDSDVMRQRFPKKVKKKKPIIGRYQCWKCGQYHFFREYCPNVPYP